MESFESDVRQFLTSHNIQFIDYTGSHTELDFTLTASEVYFDVKEKKQHMNMRHWSGTAIPEQHLFILDDLAARKILLRSPRSFLVIRNCTEVSSYYVYSVVDLLCMPKVRVRRPIERRHRTLKGKWYVDLRHGGHASSLEHAFEHMMNYPIKFSSIFKDHIDCWGNYEGEVVQTTGSLRSPQHWSTDLHER